MNKDTNIGQGAHALLNGLQSNITDLESKVAAEKDESKRNELELKRASLDKALEARKSTIESKEQLADAIDQIKYDQFLLEKLETGSFDQVDLSFLMQSDLFPFFDDASQGKLAASFAQMQTSDLVQNTLRPGAIHVEEVPGKPRRQVGFPDLLHVVDPETVDKLKLTLKEAQFIRTEKIRGHLTSSYEEVANSIAAAKQEGVFSPATIDKLDHELEEAKRLLIDENTDAALLAKAADNLPAALKFLGTSREEMEALKANRPQIETEVRNDYSKLQKAISGLIPSKLDDLLKHYQSESGEAKDSAIFRNAARSLNELGDPNSDLRTKISEFETRLEKISDITPEELLQIQADLKSLMPKVTVLENLDANVAEVLSPDHQDAKLAHKTIRDLETARTPEEIKATLETNLGSEHLEFVTKAEFEKNYRKYSKEGHMVFQEQGGKWKIILDESALTNTASVTELKKQITHELLHLEFEKGKTVKEEVRKALIESDPEKWQEIREAYIKMAKSKNKKPPHGDTWEDDDILSELYAMQNELGQTWSKGDGPTDKLNNLLVGAGVGAAIGNIAEKTREYESDAEEKIRGYESGSGGKKREGGVAAQSVEQAVYNKNREKIHAINDRLKEMKDSEHLGMVKGASELVSAMGSFNNATDGLNEDIKKYPDSQVIPAAVGARIEKVSDDLKAVESEVGKAARKAPNTEIGILRKLRLNTSFNSFEDYVQMGKDAYEFFQRRHKRNVADHAASLGMALFTGTDVGREALARKHKAESEEVEQWKGRYKHLDAWHLLAELKEIAHGIAPNKDQLKAILQILSEKGRLNWRNQDLWIALNKIQSAVILKPGDKRLLHDPILLSQRLNTALGNAFDYDEYTKLERTQGSSYGSEKSKYDPVHKRMQDKLGERLDELLAQHRNGEQVDPILYESIIEYCIKEGKTYAENVMFHLISGMATGLLGCDRGLALGGHLNQWPSIDWFPTRQPPYSTDDWAKLCKQNFATSFSAGSVKPDFMNWYWTEVQNSKPVLERVVKSVNQRTWDHDWGRSIACLGDSNTAKRFFSGRSGQEETQVTAVQNAYVGAVQWIEENSKNPLFANKENFARMAGWVVMSEGMLNGTAFRDKSKDINTRGNEAMDKGIPREATVGNHPHATTREHRDIATSFLFKIDPQFFSIFHGKEAIADEQKKALGTAARNYLMQRYPSIANKIAEVENIDQIYDRIDLIVNAMFSQMSDSQFHALLASLAPH